MGRCETCKFWESDENAKKYGRAGIYYGLKTCERAEMLWDMTGWSKSGERILKNDARMFVEDGSSYYAALLTKADFGCVEWVESEAANGA